MFLVVCQNIRFEFEILQETSYTKKISLSHSKKYYKKAFEIRSADQTSCNFLFFS